MTTPRKKIKKLEDYYTSKESQEWMNAPMGPMTTKKARVKPVRAWAVFRTCIMRPVALFPQGQYMIYWDKETAEKNVGNGRDSIVEVEIRPIRSPRAKKRKS